MQPEREARRPNTKHQQMQRIEFYYCNHTFGLREKDHKKWKKKATWKGIQTRSLSALALPRRLQVRAWWLNPFIPQ